MRISLKVKLIAIIIGIIVSTALTLTVFFIYTQKSILKKSLEKRTESIARGIADGNEFYISGKQKEYLEVATKSALLEEDVIYAVIYDRDAVELARSHITDPEIKDYLQESKPDIADPVFWKKEPKNNFLSLIAPEKCLKCSFR